MKNRARKPAVAAGPAPGSTWALLFLLFWSLTCLVWWGLAFYPLNPLSPAWLKAAQEVCFGALDGGLPNAGGWLTLFGGPAALLLAFSLAFRPELKAGLGRAGRSLSLKLAFACLLGALSGELGWVAWKVAQSRKAAAAPFSLNENGPLPQGYLRTADPLPRFHLVNQQGQRVTQDSFKGAPTVLTFVFAHCRTVCPYLIGQASQAARAKKARAAFITLDPWRDTPASLPGWAKAQGLGPESWMLSGEVREVSALLKDLKLGATRDERTGEVAHAALVYVIDKEGRIAYRFNNPPQGWLEEALERLRAEP